jgi:hypothetical protein
MNSYDLIIDSIDRTYQSDSHTNFSFIFQDFNLKNVEAITLQSLSFMNTCYNIGEGNKLDVTIVYNDGTPTATTELTITPGNYSITEFITELQNKLNTVYNHFTITYNTITNKISIDLNTFNSSYTSITLELNDDKSKDIKRFLGANGNLVLTATGTVIMTYVAKASHSDFFNVLIDPVTLEQYTSNSVQNSSILKILPLSNYGEMTSYDSTSSTDYIQLDTATTINRLQIRLEHSDTKQVINLQGNDNVVIELKLFYRSKDIPFGRALEKLEI